MVRVPEPPCNHKHEGTVSAGDPAGPFCSVATCRDCAVASAGYVQMRTGLPADPFLSYEEYRASKAAVR